MDFKDTAGGVRANHRMQLAAYALLAEEAYGRPAPAGFIYAIPSRQLLAVEIGKREREAVIDALAGDARDGGGERVSRADRGQGAMRGVRVPEFLCRYLVKVRKWRGFACRIRICEKEWVRDPEKAAILLHFGRGRRDIPDEEGTERPIT